MIGQQFFQKVQTLDERILVWAVKRFAGSKWRRFMAFLSHPPYWRPILIGMLVMAVVLGTPVFRMQLLWLTLSIILSDQTCNLIKAIVKRVRPDGLRNTAGSFWRKIGYYSFPSSHAANTFNFAVFCFQWLGYWNIPLLIIAAWISFSRVVRRNHYFSDTVAGALIGILFSLLFSGIK